MKSRATLLTELNDFRKPTNPRKSTMNTRTSRSIEELKLKSAFVIRNEKNFNETKKTMIEYLVNEETQFVDLFKCHDFYKEISYKHHNLFNSNQSDLKKKKLKLKQLEKNIEEVISSFKVGSDN